MPPQHPWMPPSSPPPSLSSGTTVARRQEGEEGTMAPFLAAARNGWYPSSPGAAHERREERGMKTGDSALTATTISLRLSLLHVFHCWEKVEGVIEKTYRPMEMSNWGSGSFGFLWMFMWRDFSSRLERVSSKTLRLYT